MKDSNSIQLLRMSRLLLCRQSPLNLHQFCLTRDSKYGLVGTDRNTICWYFASIWLYLVLLFIMSMMRAWCSLQLTTFKSNMIFNISIGSSYSFDEFQMVAITFVLNTYQMITWLNMSVKLSTIHAVIQPGGLKPASFSIFSFVIIFCQHDKSFFLPLLFLN